MTASSSFQRPIYRIAICLLVVCLGPLFLTGCAKVASGSELGRETRDLKVAGQSRSYDYYVPDLPGSGRLKGIILAFHGAVGTPSSFAESTNLHEVAGPAGFAVAYPAGVLRTWNAGLCCGPAHRRDIDDLSFVKAMIKDLKSVLGDDSLPVFATGFSNGAMMVYRVACSLSDQFVAVAPVGATLKEDDVNCSPSRPLSLLHLHGLADEHAPFAGGEAPVFRKVGRLRSVPDTVGFWVKFDACKASPKSTTSSDGKVKCVDYEGCRNNTRVAYCSVADLGHHWPGSLANARMERSLGPPSRALSATKTITEFFLQHTN